MQYQSEYLTLNIKEKDALKCAHRGDCNEDVKQLLKRLYIRRQFKALSDEQIKSDLKEYGAWSDAELAIARENKARLLWVACGYIDESLSGCFFSPWVS